MSGNHANEIVPNRRPRNWARRRRLIGAGNTAKLKWREIRTDQTGPFQIWSGLDRVEPDPFITERESIHEVLKPI